MTMGIYELYKKDGLKAAVIGNYNWKFLVSQR